MYRLHFRTEMERRTEKALHLASSFIPLIVSFVLDSKSIVAFQKLKFRGNYGKTVSAEIFGMGLAIWLFVLLVDICHLYFRT